MTLLFKLIWRDLRANPGRVAVSVFAILVSVSLIVWMMGSYDTLVREFDNDAEAYMGNYDLCLVPEPSKGPLPPGQYPQFRDPELPARLAASPLVETVNAACQVPRLKSAAEMSGAALTSRRATAWEFLPRAPSWWETMLWSVLMN